MVKKKIQEYLLYNAHSLNEVGIAKSSWHNNHPPLWFDEGRNGRLLFEEYPPKENQIIALDDKHICLHLTFHNDTQNYIIITIIINSLALCNCSCTNFMISLYFPFSNLMSTPCMTQKTTCICSTRGGFLIYRQQGQRLPLVVRSRDLDTSLLQVGECHTEYETAPLCIIWNKLIIL